MGHQFFRQELHKLVWTEPRTLLASRLGISDAGLAKACARAGIPMPGRGYWARLAAGKPVVRASLPARNLGQSDFVQLGSPDYRSATRHEDVEVPPEPVFDEPVEAVRMRAEALLLRCRVPRSLQNPHRLIGALLDQDAERRKGAAPGSFVWPRPRFDSPLALRRVRIANALFIVMAHAGCHASVTSKELDKIGFRIGDTFVQVEMETSKSKGGRGNAGTTAPDDGIVLKAEAWPPVSDVPSTWSETRTEPLETRILEIARDLIVMGELVYRAAVRAQYEWSLKRRAEMEAKAREAREQLERAEKERLERLALERREWLLRQATSRRQAEDIRALVNAMDARYMVSAGGSPSGATSTDIYCKWRAWALSEADRLDPCLGALAALVGGHLMDEPGCFIEGQPGNLQ